MLRGKIITLRPVTEEDLPQFYAYQVDLSNRGDFYSLSFRTMAQMRREFTESGMWGEDFGVLLIVSNESQKIIGQIVWFKTVIYMDEIEIGYIMYDASQRSKGGMTEALKLFTDYLFDIRVLDSKPVNRIRLTIATDNIASRRVAEKAGYSHEATQREASYSRGRHLDLELYAILRSDARPAN